MTENKQLRDWLDKIGIITLEEAIKEYREQGFVTSLMATCEMIQETTSPTEPTQTELYIDPLGMDEQQPISVFCPYCGKLQKQKPQLAGADSFIIGSITCFLCNQDFFVDETKLTRGVYEIGTHKLIKIL